VFRNGGQVTVDSDHFTKAYGGASFPMDRALLRAARLDRQTRVGILPNPNRAEMPPAHRPPLMGRWMKLRSSRRPAGQAADRDTAPDQTVAETGRPDPMDLPIVESDMGEIARIDIPRLMAAVADLGHKAPAREPITAQSLGKGRTGPAPGPSSQDQALIEALRDLQTPDAECPHPEARPTLLSRLAGLWAARPGRPAR